MGGRVESLQNASDQGIGGPKQRVCWGQFGTDTGNGNTREPFQSVPFCTITALVEKEHHSPGRMFLLYHLFNPILNQISHPCDI